MEELKRVEIGTCGECAYIKTVHQEFNGVDFTKTYGCYKNICSGNTLTHNHNFTFTVTKDFGCIHFKQKD